MEEKPPSLLAVDCGGSGWDPSPHFPRATNVIGRIRSSISRRHWSPLLKGSGGNPQTHPRVLKSSPAQPWGPAGTAPRGRHLLPPTPPRRRRSRGRIAGRGGVPVWDCVSTVSPPPPAMRLWGQPLSGVVQRGARSTPKALRGLEQKVKRKHYFSFPN